MKLIILLLTITLCSCTSNNVRDRLYTIEEQIRTEPEVALSSLDSLANAEKELFQKEEFHARYILLNTYANYRLDLEGKDDSLINIATQYFLVHGTAHDKLLCLLLHGDILINAGQYGEAMFQLKEAISDGASTQDHLLLGQTYTSLARLCSMALDSDRRLYLQKAIGEYSQLSNDMYLIDAYNSLGLALYDMGKIDSALLIIKDAKDRAERNGNNYLINHTRECLAEVECENQLYDSAYIRLNNLMSQNNYQATSIDYDILSLCLAKRGERDSSIIYSQKALALAKSNFHKIKHHNYASKVYKTIGNDIASQEELTEYYKTICSGYIYVINNSVRKEQKQFLESKLNKEINKAKMIYLFYITIITAITLGICTLYNKHKKTKRQKETIEREKEDIQTKYEIQKENKKDTIQEMKQTEVYNSFTLCLINKHEINENDWKKLYKLFNDRLPYFEQTLKKDHELNETEWRTCMLLKMDFHISDIAIIMNKYKTQISNQNGKLAKSHLGEDKGSRDWVKYIKSI